MFSMGTSPERHRRSDWERHTPWGPIEIKDDGYYLCRHCTGTGTSARPLHWYLGTDRETWSLLRQEAAVDLATDESCQGAVDKLARHHPGVAMHRSTALRLLHHHGEQARAFVADKLKAALSDAAQEGQRRQTAVELEVEYDGGMIPVATLEPMPVEPGQEAETTPVRGAPKKRKTCRWEEVKVGLAQKPGEASRIYSVRPTGELDEAFRDLLAIACLQGWGEHTEVRGIADGAHYLRTRMEDTFRACPFRCILDRPHAKEHLSDVSKRLESKQLISVSAKQWYATAVRRLEHGDVDKLIGELGHAFDRSQDDDIRKQAEYFERNKDAVSYGDYRDHGGSTASSEVDSAHRHVVQKRLKIPGAWWHPDNVRNILALRMLKVNRWWDEYWELQRQQWRTRAQRLRNQRLPDNRNPDTEISTPINEGHNLMKTRGSNGFESHPMETIISKLLQRFENGRLTRREVVQTLTLLTVSGGTAAAQGLRVRTVDHASVLVSDMARSVEFYQRVFGLSVVNKDTDNDIVRLGVDNRILVSLRREATPGVIDHFALGVDRFDREGATRELQARGVTPEPVNIDFGFHVKDPDGAIVQLTEAKVSN